MKRKFILITICLTALLTLFFYTHESFPKPLRAATALLGTPTAIVSGISYYLNLGIKVYDSPIAVVLSNFFASFILVYLAIKISVRLKKILKIN